MSRTRSLRCLLAVTVLLPALLVKPIAGQDAVPGSGREVEPVVVASGLTSPRDMIIGPDGSILVALAGSGGAQPGTDDAPISGTDRSYSGGPTAAVASIDAQGCPVLLAGGLPSAMDDAGGLLGAEDLAVLDGQLYVAVDGGGMLHGNAGQPSGIYQVYGDGSFNLVADLSSWVRENPVDLLPVDHDPDAAAYSILADEEAGFLWAVDRGSGQVLSVTADGTVNRIVDLSAEQVVPTMLTPDPDGGVYVGTMTPAPFPDGAAKVMHVATDGTVTDVWTGLTAVTDVEVGPDGTLYALEMSTGNRSEEPFLVESSGRLVRQTAEDELEVVASDLMFPVAMELGPDDAFYVSSPAIGATGGDGVILRIAPDGSAPSTEASADCDPLPETLAGGDQGVPPESVGAVTEPTVAPPAEEPLTAGSQMNEDVYIAIQGFTFQPFTIEIPAGTTVIWVNMDGVNHTATDVAGDFDTGTIPSGASASVTFDTPGTYTYYCIFHPEMQATIVVI